jgi:hypothetical protein
VPFDRRAVSRVEQPFGQIGEAVEWRMRNGHQVWASEA